MGSGPELHYTLRARTAGSFGSSLPGQIAESVTATWFRLEVSLLWAVVVLLTVAAAQDPASSLYMLIISPATAFALWVLLKLTGWVFYFIPGIGKFWGWGRIIFLWAFSRLVVQPAPTIDLPAWSARR